MFIKQETNWWTLKKTPKNYDIKICHLHKNKNLTTWICYKVINRDEVHVGTEHFHLQTSSPVCWQERELERKLSL